MGVGEGVGEGGGAGEVGGVGERVTKEVGEGVTWLGAAQEVRKRDEKRVMSKKLKVRCGKWKVESDECRMVWAACGVWDIVFILKV
jgi:hypothetical protein